MSRALKILQLLYPSGPPGTAWYDKILKGTGLYNWLLGASKQYDRDAELFEKLRNARNPDKTEFLSEWESEFACPSDDMTEVERRGRLKSRWRLLFGEKLRFELMVQVLEDSGFPGVVIRNLGANGVPETPLSFFDVGSSVSYFDRSGVRYDAENVRFDNTQPVGSALLIKNGGSSEYVQSGPDAEIQLKQENAYHGDYFVIEGEAGGLLQVPVRLYETFFDLIYLLKPANRHGILRAEFI